jgi:chromosome segregation ATPase
MASVPMLAVERSIPRGYVVSMTAPELSRKVRQLDNDVQSIYELLTEISTTQVRHGNRLDELGGQLSSIAGTQLRHGNRLDELADKLDGHDQRFDAHDQRFDAHDQRFDAMDEKLDEVLAILRDSDSTH